MDGIETLDKLHSREAVAVPRDVGRNDGS